MTKVIRVSTEMAGWGGAASSSNIISLNVYAPGCLQTEGRRSAVRFMQKQHKGTSHQSETRQSSFCFLLKTEVRRRNLELWGCCLHPAPPGKHPGPKGDPQRPGWDGPGSSLRAALPSPVAETEGLDVIQNVGMYSCTLLRSWEQLHSASDLRSMNIHKNTANSTNSLNLHAARERTVKQI